MAAILTSSAFVSVQLVVHPRRILAKPGQLCGNLEHQEAELKGLAVWSSLQNVVRLDCCQDSLLELFVVFESDLQLVEDFENATVATSV